jgi:hypothetical protein
MNGYLKSSWDQEIEFITQELDDELTSLIKSTTK